LKGVLNGHFLGKQKAEVKFVCFEKARKFEKKIFLVDIKPNRNWKIFSNFVAFSKVMKFKDKV